MLDLSIGKLLVIGLVALFLVGPDKLPQYAERLAGWVRVARDMFDRSKQRVAAELGPEFDDVDWASLDPRRYHPRRLLAEAWNAAPAERPDPERVLVPVRDTVPDLLALAEERAMSDPDGRHD